MSVGLPSRTPHRAHPHNRTYTRAWRMAAALAPPGDTTDVPTGLAVIGIALLVAALAFPAVGLLLEVVAYLRWLDTGTYTVPLVGAVVPFAPAFLLPMRVLAAAMVLSVGASALFAGYVHLLTAVYDR